MHIIEFFGGPGSGKTTGMASIFAHYKRNGIHVEMCREYAQDLIFQGRERLLQYQTILLAGQYQKYKELDLAGNKIVLSDSSMSLSKVYGIDRPHYKEICTLSDSLEGEFDITRIYVRRVKDFVQQGRVHTEAESKKADEVIFKYCGPFSLVIEGNKDGYRAAKEFISSRLGLPHVRH